MKTHNAARVHLRHKHSRGLVTAVCGQFWADTRDPHFTIRPEEVTCGLCRQTLAYQKLATAPDEPDEDELPPEPEPPVRPAGSRALRAALKAANQPTYTWLVRHPADLGIGFQVTVFDGTTDDARRRAMELAAQGASTCLFKLHGEVTLTPKWVDA